MKTRIKKVIPLIAVVVVGILCIPLIPSPCLWGKTIDRARAGQRLYEFNGTISREVLESYLSRSITFSSFLRREHLENNWNMGNVDDNFRFIASIGAKFIGRAIFTWMDETALLSHLDEAKALAERVHSMDPEIILQAAVFEAVSNQINAIPIPAWVFEEYGLEPEARNFSFTAMYDVGGAHEDYWGANRTVPDMSKLESRLWFMFLAATYIATGIEAIHFGQVALMTINDPNQLHWREMLQHVRAYATSHARRRMVICDAHVPNGGYVHDCRLLFDFHSFPLRIEEVAEEAYKGKLVLNHLDSIYGRSKGGITPSGWACDALPYLVEFDNFEISDGPGENTGGHWNWGYDEITWFALQTEADRNAWLGSL